MTQGLESFLVVSGLLFMIGVFGVLLRRNAIIMLMSLELMLIASNLALVAFSRFHATADRPLLDGPIFVFFTIAVAAAEVAIGLAILVALYRRRGTVMVDELNALKN